MCKNLQVITAADQINHSCYTLQMYRKVLRVHDAHFMQCVCGGSIRDMSACCQVISCRLIFDVLKMLVERFTEKDIDILHHVVKGCNFFLV